MTTPTSNADTAHQAAPLFYVYRLPQATDVAAGFFVESSAPDNVEVDYAKGGVAPIDAPGTDLVLPDDSATALKPLPDNDAIDAIAYAVRNPPAAASAELVVLIHGFNTPRRKAIELTHDGLGTIRDDPGFTGEQRVVFIGYRWPSERLGQPVGSTLRAAPDLLGVALGVAALLAIIGLLEYFRPRLRFLSDTFDQLDRVFILDTGLVFIQFVVLLCAAVFLLVRYWRGKSGFWALVAVLCLIFLGGVTLATRQPNTFVFVVSILWGLLFVAVVTIPVGSWLLRAVVYFRDLYRAINYGVPDLVHVVRMLDTALGGKPRVRVSFIAHSMGALVVTNLVRILTTVFENIPAASGQVNPAASKIAAATGEAARAASPQSSNSRLAGEMTTRIDSEVGNSFQLHRLVLVAPDIPAEALMQSRANYLKSTLRRFDEAYLFSSEGDEVLHLLSRLANYFWFPTRERTHGYRLGNAHIVPNTTKEREVYGIENLGELLGCPVEKYAELVLNWVYLGGRTQLKDYMDRTVEANSEQHAAREEQLPFPYRLTYLDCTDYIDRKPAAEPGSIAKPTSSTSRRATAPGMLTYAKRAPFLRWYDHTGLLLQYLLEPDDRKIDIHAGYFSGQFGERLIFRLACLGFEQTLNAFQSAATAAAGNSVSGNAVPEHTQAQLRTMSEACRRHQIRILLSPERVAPLKAPRVAGEAHVDQGTPRSD